MITRRLVEGQKTRSGHESTACATVLTSEHMVRMTPATPIMLKGELKSTLDNHKSMIGI